MKDATAKHRGEKFVSDMEPYFLLVNYAVRMDVQAVPRMEVRALDTEQIKLKNLSAGRREPSTKRKELNQANLFQTTQQKSKVCWQKKGHDHLMNAAQLKKILSEHHLSKIFKMR